MQQAEKPGISARRGLVCNEFVHEVDLTFA